VDSARTATTRPSWRVGGMVALSLLLHGAAFASLAKVRRAPVRERIAIEVVRHEAPRPAVAPPPAPPPPPPPPRRAERRVALPSPTPPAPALASPPSPAAPTPAPPEAPRTAPALPRVGISLGSTVASGGFAVAVGNTAYGKAGEIAPDPATVRPAAAGGTVAAARLSAQPKPIELPRIDYPAEARKAGTEGRVVLVLGIDAQGRVVAVRVLEAPSPSLAGAALEGARRFRFAPALLEGAPVATEIRFTYSFQLE
jgi:protein TonB